MFDVRCIWRVHVLFVMFYSLLSSIYLFLGLRIHVFVFLFVCATRRRANRQTGRSWEKEMKKTLEQFDQAWTTYEQFYVYELMVIETDARRFIIEAI